MRIIFQIILWLQSQLGNFLPSQPKQKTQRMETSPASPSVGNALLMQLQGKPLQPDELAEQNRLALS